MKPLTIVSCFACFNLCSAIKQHENSTSGHQRSLQERLIQRFPGYFRTAEEQALVEKQHASLANRIYDVDFINGTNHDTCTFSCSNGPTRKRRQVFVHQPLMEFIRMYSVIHSIQKRDAIKANKVNHGCCISNTKFVSPSNAKSVDGKNVSLVQFDDLQQYFPTDECRQVTECWGCRCHIQVAIYSAVVENEEDEDNPTIKLIELPGFCKCFNVSP